MYQISRTSLLLRRSFSSTYPLRSCGPPRLCGCSSKPKKRGVLEFLKDPCGIKPDPCHPCPPPLTQNQKICKYVLLGARVAFVTGLLYWSYRQGAFSGRERRKAFLERLRAAIDVLLHGPKICDPKKCPGCCKCEGGPIVQRLRAALCFLRYDAMSPSEVEQAIKCKTLPKNFRRCDSCSVPPSPPCPRKSGFNYQHWAPERCIFSSVCPCGTPPDQTIVCKVMQERKYDEEEYVDDYYKILKDEEEGGDDNGDSGKKSESDEKKKSENGKGKKSDGEEAGGDDNGGGDEEQQEEDPDAEQDDDAEAEEEEEQE